MDDFPFKYAPKRLDDFIFEDENTRKQVIKIMNLGFLRHVLIIGGYGTGKLSLANIIGNHIAKNCKRADVMMVKDDIGFLKDNLIVSKYYVNEIDTKNPDGTKIWGVYETTSHDYKPSYAQPEIKYLHEEENNFLIYLGHRIDFFNYKEEWLNIIATQLLHQKHAQCIFTATNISKVPKSITDQCTVVLLRQPPVDKWLNKVADIIDKEGFEKVGVSDLKKIIRKGNGNGRHILQGLESVLYD